MVGIVASLVGPAILLGKCIVVPIKRQFNYLCCFHSNIQDLRDEAKKLEDARDGLQMRVNTAANNAEEIVPQVKTWLEKANEFQVKMTGIESSIANIQSGLLAIKSRFSLSRKAKKTAEAAKELRDGCSSDPIAQPAPPVATAMIPLVSTYEFESRTRTEEDIAVTLRENKINKVGICGMGGVGKTTMAKRVKNRVKEEGLFDETVMVVVSQQADLLNIQNEIAEQLNLKLEGGSILSRAHKLRTRLQGGKRILIVLDDVWDNLKLEDLGIPCQSGLIKGCTILLTSRDSKILKAMNVQKVRALEVLSEIEAWYLFKSSAGTCIDDHNVHFVAQEIVKECKGLPIALVTVGVALKDEKNPNIWNHALDQLKSSNPIDMPEVLEDVYKPLRISHDLLKSESAKSLFLLCCLFPEDSNVSITNLTYFAMALHMLEGIRNLEQTRNSVWSLVEMLKSRFLLLDDDNFRETIKMHDVVRDVAIFIASKERRIINCSDCTWISSYHLGESSEFPEGLNPNLRLLLIDNFGNKDFKINDGFFEGTRELNVLSISNGSLRSLPHATKLLKNLRTLILNSCSFLENISVVGQLVNLEIFICCFCESIMELPAELRGLHRLRLLEFSYCRELKTIAPGLISTLVGLEELKMLASFDQWEGDDKEGKERTNAGLKELESLSNLTCLEIEVEDFTLAAEQIRLSPKIMKFDITIGGYHQVFRFSSKGFEKNLKLHLDRGITLGNWIHKFLRNVEYMCLQGEGSNKLELRQAQNVRSLTFKNCSTMKKLVTITTSSIDYGRCDTTTATLFSLLEFLDLSNLPNLEEICDVDGPIPNEGSRSNIAFKNLKILRLVELSGLKHPLKSRNQNIDSNYNNLSSVYIEKCHSLRTLFSLSTVKNCLPQLETLEIMYCDKMEQVFLNEEENEKNIGQSCHIMIFPKLWRLRLKNLVNLIYFCKGIESIEFPQLAQMHIEDCPQLKSLVSTTSPTVCGLNDHDDDDADSLHLFCKPEKVAFGSLKKLHIDGFFTLILWCHQIPNDLFTRLQLLVIRSFGGIRSLFSSSIARNLVNLTELEIEYCREMVKVIEDDGEKYSHKTICLFLKLQILKLNHLPSLKTFCDWRCDFEFPSLEDVQIYQCPQMERFTLTSPSTPKLRTIGIDYQRLKDQDLNGALQQHFLEKESFYKWEAKVKGVQSLLSRLTGYLRIEMKDSTLAAEQISIPSNIVKYDITIGDIPRDFRLSLMGFDKRMHLYLPREITLGNWFHQCVRSVECLLLEGEGSNNLDLRQAQNVRWLAFIKCSTVKKLVNITTSSIDDDRYGTNNVFCHLESLELDQLINLEEICDINGPIPDEGFRYNSFMSDLKRLKLEYLPALKHLWKNPCQNVGPTYGNLSSIGIYRCGSLPYLFCLSLSMANACLLQLKTLEIVDCKMMEEVFSWEKEEENKKGVGQESCHIKIFPNLKRLKLFHLPSLTAFCKGIESIEFPLLTLMDIEYCPKLKTLASITSSTGNNQNHFGGINHYHDEDVDSLHLFCKSEKVVFGSLKELRMYGYENISSNTLLHCHQVSIDFFNGLDKLEICNCGRTKSLFASSRAKNLVSLRELRIYFCRKMVKVIEDDEEEKYSHISSGETICLFPRLQQLKLEYLPRLKIFCKWSSALELPSLEEMSIDCCPKMERFNLGSLTTPNLNIIKIDNVDIINMKDLNCALQQHFFKEKEEEQKMEEEREEEEQEEKEEQDREDDQNKKKGCMGE